MTQKTLQQRIHWVHSFGNWKIDAAYSFVSRFELFDWIYSNGDSTSEAIDRLVSKSHLFDWAHSRGNGFFDTTHISGSLTGSILTEFGQLMPLRWLDVADSLLFDQEIGELIYGSKD